MPVWEALGMAAVAAWVAYAIGYGNGESAPHRPTGAACTAGDCPQCHATNTEYYEFVDRARSMRSLRLVRVKRGFCNSCLLNWDDATPHWDGVA